MARQRLIVFDIDGTLTDSVDIHHRAFYKSLHELGVKEIDKEFHDYKHYTDLHIAKVIFEKDRNEPFSQEKALEFEELLLKNMNSSSVSEIKGAFKLIDHLKTDQDFSFCFATGSMLLPALFKLESSLLNVNKELVIASNNIEERERIVQTSIEKCKDFYQIGKFDQIISIGDGLWDLKTAENLGLEFIGVGEKNRKSLESNGATVVCTNLEELLAKLV